MNNNFLSGNDSQKVSKTENDSTQLMLNEEQQEYLNTHTPAFLQEKYPLEIELTGDLIEYQPEYDENGKVKLDGEGNPIIFKKDNGEALVREQVLYDDTFEYDLKRAYEVYDQAVSAINQRVSISDNTIIKDNVLTKLATKILDEAIKAQVEDVFITNNEHFGIVRFFNGTLWKNHRLIAKNATDPLITILKKMAGMETKIENAYRNQTNGTIYHNHHNFRIATGTANFGMFMSLRMESGYFDNLDDLNLPISLKKAFREQLKASSGMTVITGGTGSGKSTLATAGLVERQKQARGQLNIISLEKPVEVTLAGMLQIEINEDKGLTWSDAIEGTLRERPDILRVGEVNGKKEAQAMVRVGNAGCTSITTLHANTVLNVFDTLRAYEISDIDVQNALKLVIYLARVPKLCPYCKIETPLIRRLNDHQWIKTNLAEGHAERMQISEYFRRNPEGCEHCRPYTNDKALYGTLGKIGLYEYLQINSSVLQIMRKFKGKENYEIKQALLHPDMIHWGENEINEEDLSKLSDNILFEPLERDVLSKLRDGDIDLETAKNSINR